MSLPGSRKPSDAVSDAIRVNHAGEYGARRIYEGQLAVLKGKKSAAKIREMHEQELEHLQTFDNLIRERKVRPSALMPLWHVGGFALGAVTALMGEKAAMACTVAVESVIGEHYSEQLESLPEKEEELKDTVRRFRDDEQAHHDTGLAEGAESAAAYPLLYNGIRAITKSAVWIAKRV